MWCLHCLCDIYQLWFHMALNRLCVSFGLHYTVVLQYILMILEPAWCVTSAQLVTQRIHNVNISFMLNLIWIPWPETDLDSELDCSHDSGFKGWKILLVKLRVNCICMHYDVVIGPFHSIEIAHFWLKVQYIFQQNSAAFFKCNAENSTWTLFF